MDERSRRNLDTLLPAVQPVFETFYARANAYTAKYGVVVKFISGTRGEAEQNALYAKGRTTPGPKVTNARYGYSNHNFKLAIDVGLFKGSDYLEESTLYRDLGPIGRACGLDWGGYWKSPDYPHYEFPTGLTIAEKRERITKGLPLVYVPEKPVPQTKTWSLEVGGKQILAKVTSTPEARAIAEALGATVLVDAQAKIITLVPKAEKKP